MVQDADGVWHMVLENPMFEEAKNRWDEDIKQKKLMTKPRKIAQAMFGGKADLDESLRDGSAWVDHRCVLLRLHYNVNFENCLLYLFLFG